MLVRTQFSCPDVSLSLKRRGINTLEPVLYQETHGVNDLKSLGSLGEGKFPPTLERTPYQLSKPGVFASLSSRTLWFHGY